jgi:hypothetical protein
LEGDAEGLREEFQVTAEGNPAPWVAIVSVGDPRGDSKDDYIDPNAVKDGRQSI